MNLIKRFGLIILTVYGFFKELIILRTCFIKYFDRLKIGRFGVEKGSVRLHCARIAASGCHRDSVAEAQASIGRVESGSSVTGADSDPASERGTSNTCAFEPTLAFSRTESRVRSAPQGRDAEAGPAHVLCR